MDANTREIFVYGLHMDPEVLRAQGIEPGTPRRAHVDGFALHLGQFPTLVPRAGGRVHGMVYALEPETLRVLLAWPEIAAYRAEGVLAWIEGGTPRPVLCFRLAQAPAANERNEEYLRQLQETLARLGFPPDTIASAAGTADID
jgi:gamma-glutamylcyclotransferase (GGCT)/AIG2-like uncharacterized protein YtfP